MEKNIFRKKSIERISSPENLNEYMHVVSPAPWLVLGAVILLLVGMIVWSFNATISSRVYGFGIVDDDVMTIAFSDEAFAQYVEAGMMVTVGDISVPITSVGKDDEGYIIAGAQIDIPDGFYEVTVDYKQTQLIQMLYQ